MLSTGPQPHENDNLQAESNADFGNSAVRVVHPGYSILQPGLCAMECQLPLRARDWDCRRSSVLTRGLWKLLGTLNKLHGDSFAVPSGYDLLS